MVLRNQFLCVTAEEITNKEQRPVIMTPTPAITMENDKRSSGVGVDAVKQAFSDVLFCCHFPTRYVLHHTTLFVKSWQETKQNNDVFCLIVGVYIE